MKTPSFEDLNADEMKLSIIWLNASIEEMKQGKPANPEALPVIPKRIAAAILNELERRLPPP